MKKNVYDLVTNQIISLMEKGEIPWRKPWKSNGKHNNGGAINWNTGRSYRGINQLLLGWSGEWATFKQITDAGGKVKKGEKSQVVFFYTTWEKENSEGESENIPVAKLYNVFEINTQCTGLESRRNELEEEEREEELSVIEQAELIVKNFMNCPDLVHKSGEAFYHPMFDRVVVPPMNDYKMAEEYYSTLYHELVHSTAHTSRLNRKLGVKFGDHAYSKEELIAEIGAAMLCGVAGIEQQTIENSAAYISHWLKVLKNDKTLIVTAASAAQKASDYILGVQAKVQDVSKAV